MATPEFCTAGLEVDDDFGADVVEIFPFLNGVLSGSVRLPAVSHAVLPVLGKHLDLVSHHECRVEAHTELANDGLRVHFTLGLQRRQVWSLTYLSCSLFRAFVSL